MEKLELLNIIKQYLHENKKPVNQDVVTVSGASISDEDLISVIDSALEGWFTEGKKAHEFALALKRFFGVRFVQLCNSGSSANLLALLSVSEHIDKSKPKFVITCATGFPTTVTPIYQAGLFPYFVDINPRTLNVNYQDVLHLLDLSNVVGVMLAHTLGFPIGGVDLIAKRCQELGKFFVEDCCDVLGGKYNQQKVGTFGDISTSSFFPAHHITTGEGGAVLTNNAQLHLAAESYTNWGRSCWCLPGKDNTCGKRFSQQFGSLPYGYDHKYVFGRMGYNLKMTELQAALGLSQMNRVEDFVQDRKDNFEFLQNAFYEMRSDIYSSTIQYPVEAEPSPFGFPITVVGGLKSKAIAYLESNGIRTRPVFAGNITCHPMMDNQLYLGTDNPGSDYVMNNTFWVGVHPSLTYVQLCKIVDTCKEFEKGI